MPSPLGKRTRSSCGDVLDVPAKRTRTQTKGSSAANDENQDPREARSIDAVLEDRKATLSSTKTGVEKSCIPLTPKTPRFRDALSSLPTTPRHRVMSAGKLSTRLTPKTPSTPSTCQTIYHLARQLFSRSNDPGQLIGRDAERARLEEFLTRCTSSSPSGCLYVSGPPGTGKSAMVNAVTEQLSSTTPSIRKAYINCMSIKSSNDLYITLLEQLAGDAGIFDGEPAAALQELFIPRKKGSGGAFLVVLDEIDHILTLDLESLYKVFEWALQKSSRVCLVGIANALDLTDRFLPRLKSRSLKPDLLPFLPYSAVQIKAIVSERLKSLMPADSSNAGFTPFFHPAAIELCSRKVASQSGDLRKAYEILRRALDLVEAETKQKLEDEARQKVLQMTPSRKPLGEAIGNAGSPSKATKRSVPAEFSAALQALTVENAPRVSIGHLNKITATAFGNGASQRLKSLNLQQKAALCALMAIEKRNKAAVSTASPITPSKSRVTAPTVKELYDKYSVLCKRDSLLHALSSSEFREVIGSLETLSLITAVDGKTGSFAVLQTPSKKGRKATFNSGDERQVASCVGEKEIEQGVDGLGSDILRCILSGQALD